MIITIPLSLIFSYCLIKYAQDSLNLTNRTQQTITLSLNPKLHFNSCLSLTYFMTVNSSKIALSHFLTTSSVSKLLSAGSHLCHSVYENNFTKSAAGWYLHSYFPSYHTELIHYLLPLRFFNKTLSSASKLSHPLCLVSFYSHFHSWLKLHLVSESLT